MAAAVWTLIGAMFAAMAVFLVDARAGRRNLASELRAETGGLRAEMGGLRAEMGGLHAEMGSLRRELREEIGGVREELRGEAGGLRTELGGLRAEVHRLAEHQAEMNGQLGVLLQMAHTHDAA